MITWMIFIDSKRKSYQQNVICFSKLTDENISVSVYEHTKTV